MIRNGDLESGGEVETKRYEPGDGEDTGDQEKLQEKSESKTP